MATTSPPNQIPVFISSFTSPTTFFYFLHIINPDDATLTIQVIGPNLTFTFQHSRALDVLSRSERLVNLERKTCGFSAIVRRGERHILAWSESGHGFGQRGDILDADPQSPVLNNRIWTSRVVKLAKILGCSMGSPYDKMGERRGGRDTGAAAAGTREGIFAGSHVELKLATHAIYTLLEMFNITSSFSKVTRAHLRSLRRVRWADGGRPTFEIYFSRRNCARCGSFVRALVSLTGIRIRLCWRDRLTHKIYTMHASKSIAASARRAAIPVGEEDDNNNDRPIEMVELVDPDDLIDLGTAIVVDDEDGGPGNGYVIEDDDDDVTVGGDDDDEIEIISHVGGRDGRDRMAGRGAVNLVTPFCSPRPPGNFDDYEEDFVSKMAAYSDRVNGPIPQAALIDADYNMRHQHYAAGSSFPTCDSSPLGLGFFSP